MSFGPSSQQKSEEAAAANSAKQQADLATASADRGSKSFAQFNKALKGPLDFYRGILSGDQTKIGQLLQTPIESIKSGTQANLNQINDLLPRGGGKSEAAVGAIEQGNKGISDLVSQAQPQAAQALEGIAGLYSGESLGQSGLANQGFTGAAQTNTTLDQLQLQRQQMAWQFIGDLFKGAGEAAGGALFGGA